MKKLKKYTGIGLGIIAAPVVIYGVYKTNVAPELINKKNNSLFLSKSKQGLSFPRSSAKPNAKKSTALDLDITLKSAGNIEKKFQIMINTSNIKDGWFANIFEDSSGNLWSMGKGTPLQVLRKGKNIWEEAGHKSNITDGWRGAIFEDSSKNLWSVGKGTPLQVLKKGETEWKPAGHNSNITGGTEGTIFEDSSGNLWSMGNNGPLQVLDKNETEWKSSSGSNIKDGSHGIIYEDSKGTLWSMANGTALQFLKKDTNTWVSAGNGSNITDGRYGDFFEDSSGNLWSMGLGTPLQVLRKGKNIWEKAGHSSNIADGEGGTIFEDSSGNLWSMGNNTPLQVLRSGKNTWELAANGSNITNGEYGTIFEDSSGNLWSMGYGTPLQVLKKGSSSWRREALGSNIKNGSFGKIFEDSEGNLWSVAKEGVLQVKPFGLEKWINNRITPKSSINNSNITDGETGTIFEDSSGNLWSMGDNTPLQVLKKGANTWEPAAHGSNITNGFYGTIFEDSSGNLWSMGYGTPLQVLRSGENSWEEAGNSSNLMNGTGGTIFEDLSGNLWSMGKWTPLQVLRKGKTEWEPAGHNSNITKGYGGTIFEDSSGNLWSMGNNTPLQVLKKGATNWELAAHSSNITDGALGTIFEDSSGNLWSMGKGTPLQVLRSGENSWEEAGNSSNLMNGTGGTIFEDSSGNLWSMGLGTPLQVLRKGRKTWEEAGHSSNIINGYLGTIFEDSSGNLWSTGKGTPLQVLRNGENTWKEAGHNSNITDGKGGTIFEDSSGNLWSVGKGTPLQVFANTKVQANEGNRQVFEDSFGNLWSMGNRTPLQVLRNGTNTWEPAGHSSNIINGYLGTIFEDSSGNLWSMGRGTPLQVLKKGANTWEPAAHGSNIADGEGGTILEDSSGNLWSMGLRTPLQVLRNGTNTWEPAGHSSNITEGWYGTIFEDSSGNLWSMGHGTPLQVLRNGTNTWEPAGHSSNITNGRGGTIFEDSSGNLWSMGYGTPLQVLRNGTNTWEPAGHSSNITEGWYGTIFEDSSGNLWSMGYGTPLQVLRDGKDTWEPAGHSSNITDGYVGAIFEDSYGNLWSMGFQTPLQVLIKNTTEWKEPTYISTANNSNITNGYSSTIFEDSSGNLWSMGGGTELQVKKPTKGWDKFLAKKIFSNKYNLSLKNDRFYLKGDLSDINRKYFKLKYKLSTDKAWKDFDTKGVSKGTITTGEYQFKWVINSNLKLTSSSKQIPNIPNQIVIDAKDITGTPIENKGVTSYIGANDGKITLPTTGLPTGVTIQVNKDGVEVTDLNNLAPGAYSFKYILGENILTLGTLLKLNSVVIAESDITQIDGTIVTAIKPRIDKDTTSFKGNNDGSITTPTLPEGVKLVVTKDGNAFNKTDFTHLKAGVYVFKYESKDKYIWKNGRKPSDVSLEIKESDITQIDGTTVTVKPTIDKDTTSFKGNNDGSITTPTLPEGVKLVVTKDGNAFNKTDFTHLKAGVYVFKYESQDKYIWKNGSKPIDVSLEIKESDITQIDGTTVTVKPTIDKDTTSFKGNNDGSITTPTLPEGVKLVVTKDGNAFNKTDFTHLKAGVYVFKYELKDKYIWKNGSKPIDVSLEIKESDITQIDGATVTAIKPTIDKDTTSFKGNNDGSITTPTLPEGVKLVVTKDGNAFNKTDFHNLSAGEYVFKYELEDKYIWKNGSKPTDVKLTIKDSTIIQVDGSVVAAKPNLTKDTTSYIGAKDGEIDVPVLPNGFEFVVTKDGNAFNGTDFNNLEPGVYKFTYQLKSGFVLKTSTDLPTEVSLTISESTLIGIDSTQIIGKPIVTKTTTSYIGANDGEITLPTTGLPTGVTIQVSKGGVKVTDIKHLSPGTYDMKYVLDTSKCVLKSGTLPILTSVVITESNITQIDGAIVTAIKPTISKDTTSFKGNNDGSINVPYLPTGIKLVVTKDGKLFNETDFHNLSAGEYVFKYELEDKYIWKNGSKPADVTLTIKDSTIIQVDGSTVTVKPSLTKDTTSYIGANDGSITVPTLPEGVKLVVAKNGNAFTGDLTKLSPGVYKFTYKLKNNFVLKPNTNLPADVSLITAESTLIGIDPTTITGSPTDDKTTTSYIGANDGKITLPTTGLPTGVTIQVSKGGVKVTDLKHLAPGTYDMKYVLDTSKYVLKSGTLPILTSVVITESNITQIDGATVIVKPTTSKDTTSFKGNNDGFINVPALPTGIKLVVFKDGKLFKGADFSKLSAGEYIFKYELKDKYIWKNGSKPADVTLTIKDAVTIQVDGSNATAKPSLTKGTTSYIGANDGSINVPVLPEGFEFGVTKDGNAFSGDLTKLSPGVYKFTYKLKNNFVLKPNTNLPADVSLTITKSALTGIDPKTIVGTPTDDKTTTSYIGANDGKITLPTTGLPTGVTIQVSKGGVKVTDIKHLAPGTYDMKYVLDTSKYVLKSGTLPILTSVVITESDITQIDGAIVTAIKPTISKDTTSFKGNNDGSINVPYLPIGIKLVVTKDGKLFNETDFHNLGAGEYVFKYELEDKYIWKNGSKPADVTLTIKDSTIIQVDGSTVTVKPSLTKGTTSYIGANDGSINVPVLPEGFEFEVTKDGKTFSGDLTKLSPGVYKFTYKLKNNFVLKPNTNLPADVSLTITKSALTGIDPKTIVGTPTDDKTTTSYIGANDGKITLPTTGLPTGVTIQVSKGGVKVTDLKHLAPGTYDMKYVLDTSKYVLKSGTLPILTSVVITESNITQIDGATVIVKPTTSKDTTSFKGNNDGFINVPALPTGIKLVVFKDGKLFKGADFSKLSAGEYIFKYELKDKYIWKNGSKPADVTLTIKDAVTIQVDGSNATAKPSLTKGTTSYIGANDGSINVPVLPEGFEFGVTKDGNAFSGDLTKLSPGVYKFTYKLKNNFVLKPNTNLPADVSLTITKSALTGIDPKTIVGTPTDDKTTTSYIGANDGKITLPTTGLPTGVTIQVSKGGVKVTDIKHLAPGTYDMKYVLDTSKYVLKSGTLPILTSVVITESDITQIDGAIVTAIKPTISKDTTSFKGNNDGSINVPYLPIGIKLVVTKDGKLFNETDFHNLGAGEYVFKYELEDKYIWKNGSKPADVTLTIKDSTIIQVDGSTVTVKPSLTKDTTSYIGANDGSINVPVLPEGFEFEVTKDGNAFTGDLTKLSPGVYKFTYKLKNNFVLKPNTNLPADVSLIIAESTLIGIDSTQVIGKPIVTKTTTSYIGANDGEITSPTTGLPTGVTIQVSKGGVKVTDLKHLAPGTYDMKYVLDTSKYVLKSGTLPILTSVVITESNITQIDGAIVTAIKPTIDKDITSFKGNNDGSITMPTLPEGVKFVVTKDGNAFNKTDFTHLKAGVYVFKYESKDKYIWKNGSKPTDVKLTIKDSTIIQVDGSTVTVKPSLTKDTTSYIGANDGSITVPTLPEGVKLVVAKNGNAFNGTDFNNLEPGVYKFTYKLKNNFVLKPNTNLPADVSLIIAESTLIGIDPTTITGSPTDDKTTTSYIGANDGKITLPTTGLPTGVTIQVSKGGVKVTDLKHLAPGTYDMKYVLDTSKYVLKSGTLPILTSVVITESNITQIDGATVTVKPTTSKDTTSFKGNNDGSINVPALPTGVKFVVFKDGKLFKGADFSKLSAGEYIFKYELKDKYIWKNGSKPTDVKLTIKDSTIIQVDGSTVTVKPSLTKDTTSYIGANDGSINVPVLPEGFEFEVTKDGNAFSGDLTKLSPGVYKFTYKLKNNFVLKPNTNLPADVSLTITKSALTGIDPKTIVGTPTDDKTTTSYIGANDGEITLPTTGLPTGVTIQVSKGGVKVTDIKHLSPGTYDMKYVLDTSKCVLKSGTLPILTSVVITESNITQIDGAIVTAIKPTIDKGTTSFKGNNDGSINVPYLPTGIKLVVTKDGKLFNETDFHNLGAGEYVFKYELEDKYIWKNGSKPADVTLTIKDSTIIQVDGSTVTVKPSLTKDTTSYIGANDGSITVPTLPEGVKLVVTKNGNAFNETDFNNLEPGVYKFTYQLKSGFVLKTGTSLPNEVKLKIKESTLIGIDPTQITGKPIASKTTTSYIGANDGKITLPTGVAIQVSKGGVKVTDLKHLAPGTYDMKYVLDTSKYVLKSGTLPNLVSVEIINPISNESKNKKSSNLKLIIYIISSISGVSLLSFFGYKIIKKIKNKY